MTNRYVSLIRESKLVRTICCQGAISVVEVKEIVVETLKVVEEEEEEEETNKQTHCEAVCVCAVVLQRII
jgi:hypothetical protein